ncbi:MAG: hypothetical protein ABIL68_01235 [bacterium]
MKIKSLIFIIVVATLIIGCGATRPVVEVGGYTFEYEGKTYRIESLTPKSHEGYNYLILREEKKVVLRAIDKEQDGLLDEVITGNVTLEKAQAIYTKGITLASTQGHVNKRNLTRVYKMSDVMNDYVLETHILAVGEVYNRFSVQKRVSSREYIIALDRGANGDINEMDKELNNLSQYQDLYTKVLSRGLADGKIVMTEGMYQVVMK